MEIVHKLILSLIRTIDSIIPKSKSIILLRSDYIYPDNIQALLECMIRYDVTSDHMIICEGKGFNKYKGEHNIRLTRRNSIWSLYYFFRSYYHIYDIGLHSASKTTENHVSLNVWHGTGLKVIGFYLTNQKPFRTATYTIAYSKLFAEKVSYAFGVPIENVIIANDPRVDYYKDPVSDRILERLSINANNTLIIWMPTYRKSIHKNETINGVEYSLGVPFVNEDNLPKLDQICKSRNIDLIIKWHGLETTHKVSKEYSNIKFLTSDSLAQENIPLYSIVSRCSGLITDYSSIYLNYLSLNRPICFAYDDIETYKMNRGFMFDNVESLMPGYKAKSFDDIIAFVESIGDQTDEYKVVREKASKCLCEYLPEDCSFEDNTNSFKILKEIGLLQKH